MNRNQQNKYILKSAGFTLTEILVGLLIGLIGTIVIFQVFAVAEGQKRTTTASGDAQQNGTFALYTLAQDIRNAGSGIVTVDAAVLGCTVRAYNQNATPATSFTLRLNPVMILDGGGTAPDEVTIMYGTSNTISMPVTFTAPAAPSSVYRVASSQGFNLGDLVLAIENPEVTPYPDCTLAQVTNTPGSSNNIIHNPGISGPFNKPAGHGVSYSASAVLLNIGNPIINRYFVSTNATTQQSDLRLNEVLLGSGTTNPLVNNVINLQAQYGVDTNEDNVIDRWQEPTGSWAQTVLTAAQAQQIKAIRIAVITRSAQPEKSTSTSVAPSTLDMFADSAAGAAAVPISIPLTTAQRLFRYEVFETVVPLRNVIWNY